MSDDYEYIGYSESSSANFYILYSTTLEESGSNGRRERS